MATRVPKLSHTSVFLIVDALHAQTMPDVMEPFSKEQQKRAAILADKFLEALS